MSLGAVLLVVLSLASVGAVGVLFWILYSIATGRSLLDETKSPEGGCGMKVILLSRDELEELYDYFNYAYRDYWEVRVAVDEDEAEPSFKIKVGRGTWSRPMGRLETND